jgi:hypothetical protein
MKDFSKERKQLQFKIDGDTFTAVSAVPAQTLVNFAAEFSQMSQPTIDQQIRAFSGVLELVLMPESLALFTKRMSDPVNPIDVDQVEQIVTWLFEEYGMRPTEQPSGSPDGLPLPVSGTNSTESTPAVPSTFLPSPSTSS